ncbi:MULTISPECIES: sugar kinase [Pseudoalteromonas]|jgi:2-dehydro-3-deoxygluconokinase|uniref:Sugar kinase n=1 Tax=Pseudoalteromonas distincta TaxID=77608 RepID=A0ABT9GD75_9GAMM|nr:MULTISPECIES: sugar kinase [Pseudoalteromonas]KAA1161819.1 sugar kinase [Pseudoalteromonas distincta]KHM50846.1 ketodeoxygluconokinase [Pseudoalteromonas elyakovii]KID35122.1 ketodeoxygluconokinase [Pseudoalteromonas distincta]MBB1339251.1 sugar kinase [Pseudoalteromonas sp. SR44-2]MBB1345285.1 sugar kinase [Pseudoalteromonas sp. SG45-2]|tara:strand:- start:24455 stop:25387 length:933 start_codon:yes stop_codon:yes gene_type:complete
MKNIYFIGECMVELRAMSAATLHQSFAGDVYNSAVYLKRCFPQVTTSVVTALGQDNLSKKMLERFESEQINTQLVFAHDTKVPGMYYIETDEHGERSFIYWRNDSAAKKVVDFLDADALEQLSQGDMFFFSGISLAIIEESAREDFWKVVKQLKDAGVKIVFDPNYRARLWNSVEETKEQYHLAFTFADITLPGVEDLTTLYDVHSVEAVVEYLKPYQIEEIVVKNGPESVVTKEGDTLQSHTIIPVTNVVDTTSAGDAFNGVYLGARLSDKSISSAVQLAAKAAGTVIQQPGAIAPKDIFQLAMAEAGI